MNPSSVEHRLSQRKRTLLGAKIVFNDGTSVYECVIRNMSDTGALVQSENSLAAPPTFSLQLTDGRVFACEVIWRKASSLGVKYRVRG
ncbi:PilZ domain-containing protein [Mycoplana sp. BE70]|uniref:PilZ domain-containing protein n=1 Tax=Mycoplana sp. BE70 TaxID=2817775 RepID=UPI00286BD4B6|nr:PilZ domain-containing protein [Mycoplana sp. BE70]